MESNHLATRTYTAPTCELIITPKGKQLSRLDVPSEKRFRPQQQQHNFDFTLNLDRDDRGELERVVLQGRSQQLERLQQIVSQYIAELVAKFPSPSADLHPPKIDPPGSEDPVAPVSSELPDDEPSISNQLYPNTENQALKLGLMKNLPGLRNNPPPASATGNSAPAIDSSPSPLSKLFGFWNKPNDRQSSTADRFSGVGTEPLTAGETAKSATSNPTTPYLTGGDRSLDHQLHLGDLATPASGAMVNLSAIQLFDLAIVLDEFALENTTTNTSVRSTPLDRRANVPL
jgi:hypothetical protein